MSSAPVIVIGGGVGGLTTAIRLRAAGHPVTLFERRDVVGGKLAVHEADGYSFDVGPSLLTLPHVFADVFRLAGSSINDEVDLVRLEQPFHYWWPDGARLTVHDDADATAAAFDEFAAGAGEQWRHFDARGKRIWDVAERTFFAGPMSNPLELMRRMRSPRDLLAIDPLRSLYRAAASTFEDRRLVQWAGRYATYSGSSPFEAPATLACIPHIESRYGCWYVRGGLGALADALARVAVRAGVEIVTGAEVERVLCGGPTSSGEVTGVRLADGSTHDAAIVVANVDAKLLYRDLVGDEQAAIVVDRAAPSTSGFVLCLGVRGATTVAGGEPIGHHNVWFSPDYAIEFDQLAAGHLATDPTIYACVSSVTDPTQAPDGCENWFLLVNTPPGVSVDREAYAEVILDRLESFGVELRSREELRWTMTPHDIASRYRAPGGAIYGSSSNGRRAAFVRPRNRGSRPGLYLVGGSSHPGGGLPLVATSGRIVADLVADDVRRGRIGAA